MAPLKSFLQQCKKFFAGTFEEDRKRWLDTCAQDWDEQSLQSYLLAQIPEEKECEALLIRCMPSLWALVGYFAQWPFNTSFSPMTNLTFLASSAPSPSCAEDTI
ncbi:unnamed protein product [Clonostachys rosea f. rosea IK726]|uniref:Uncharacterized protein n=2 Tax=Bionectria ochroleuca TaxID=29856 RepID=A0A0B7JUQ7_BIOOC|nr:unnamed protein product [Clonostachys rosea f. rosea IK726]